MPEVLASDDGLYVGRQSMVDVQSITCADDVVTVDAVGSVGQPTVCAHDSDGMIGKYQIGSALFRGTQGCVFLTEDGGDVIKLVREVRSRFRPGSEAELAISLAASHPKMFPEVKAVVRNVRISAEAFLEGCGSCCAIVMEKVVGSNLQEIMKNGPMELHYALHISLQILLALDAMHSQGIIHRDLKPANVMITPDGKIKLIDFGISGNILEEIEVSYGTQPYMSLEMWTHPSLVDRRHDLYSFGVVLHEMLTGKLPLDISRVDTPMRYLVAINRGFTLKGDFSPELTSIFGKLLTKLPNDRYRSAFYVAQDIARLIIKNHPELRSEEPYYSLLGRVSSSY